MWGDTTAPLTADIQRPLEWSHPILIIPGLGGSGPGHWQTVWEDDLPNARRVEQSDWDTPKPQLWIANLTKAIAEQPGSLLIAHSLGCVLVAHVARCHPNLPISGAMLVAPADVDSECHTQPPTRRFAPMPLVHLPFPSIVVASHNDPCVSFDRARCFAEAWGSRFIDVGSEGHINVAAGHGAWPAGKSILRSFTREVVVTPPLDGGQAHIADHWG